MEYITKDEALLQLTGNNLPKDRDSYIALVTNRVQDIPATDVVERSKVNAAIEKIKNFSGYKEGLDTMNVGDDIMISWLITLEILKNI